MAARSPSGSFWCFTVYDLESFRVPDTHQHFKYCVYQPEVCPHTGTWHYQGYIEFTRTKSMGQVKLLLNDDTAHLELRRATALAARDYCMKPESRVPDTEPVEFGVWDPKTPGQRSDLVDIYAKVKARMPIAQIADEHPGSYTRYYKNVAHLRTLPIVDKPTRTVDLKVTLLYGPPGCGKTRMAYYIDSNLYATPVYGDKNLWFDGYIGEKTVLLDDFSGQMALSQFLRLIDRYPVQVPIKGGYVWWCPERILISTNVMPYDWYDYHKRPDSMMAVRRRFTNVLNFKHMDADGIPAVETVDTFWPVI